MSNAWEYKEDDWQEHASLEYTIKERDRKDSNIWTKKILRERIQSNKERNEQAGLYYHVVTDYKSDGNNLLIHLHLDENGTSSFGFGVDKKGYPIEYPERLHKDFPTPPVDIFDARKQVDKLNRDLYMDFPTWLGHHSREGWEIFKISRDFRGGSQEKRTWCVFRRKI